MIEVQGVSKAYPAPGGGAWPWRRAAPPVQAVRAVSFGVADRSITGLLGPNGAGKTTTLRMVAARVLPDAGTVRVDGIDVAADPQAVRARLGVLSDARGLYPRLSARENIVYHGRLHGLDTDTAAARADELARLLEMQPLLDRRTEGFSQGERMKTALARALVHRPSHLILDEPTNGLDVLATRALREALRTLRDEAGQCIVFCTHIMQEVERLCDRVVVVAGGRTVAEGSVPELLACSGCDDFEAAFVRLAYADDAAAAAAAAARVRP
ncbi:ABC transporter ATP-binding protein [Aquabacterium sp. OR-4]|uniref:ABC transporter ATP-binding protein n=1 Tax=Aquabacterium sp. OR-4 TaxID=2978127 RepID=UPI0021B29C5B|nr:ATP-binding cassette domain-containing protein [Aquabacterium sp. OR-4]MDT7833681.1 ATP-binding cassette domain-containing protein [Aquabacterium sp. OR-4]